MRSHTIPDFRDIMWILSPSTCGRWICPDFRTWLASTGKQSDPTSRLVKIPNIFVFWISGSCEHPGDNNNKTPKAEPFVSASEGEVWIVRPVGGLLADEGCAHTYIIYTHDIITVVYVDSLASLVLIISKAWNTFKYVNVNIKPYLNTRLYE